MNRRDFLRVSAAAPAAAALFGQRAFGDTASQTAAVELADPKSFTLVALPDTQFYCESWPHHFHNQTKWIVDNAERLNIRYVLHEGDIVNNNTPVQWDVAKAALARLDGVVPCALVTGNHDHGEGGNSNDRSTLLNDYLSAEVAAKAPTFGGVLESGKLQNSYHVFEAGGHEYLVLALEWAPRDEAVAWANKIADEHPDRRLILLTHAYMYYDETRYDWAANGEKQEWNPHVYAGDKLPGGINDGQQLWDKLIKPRKNFLMTLNGHVCADGAARLSSRGDHGNMVHQILANYQMNNEGGEGFLRLIEFLPDDKTIRVRSYSPSLGTFKTDDQQQFTLAIEGM